MTTVMGGAHAHMSHTGGRHSAHHRLLRTKGSWAAVNTELERNQSAVCCSETERFTESHKAAVGHCHGVDLLEIDSE